MHVMSNSVHLQSGVATTLSTDYGYVLLSAVLLALELLVIGFVAPGKARAKYFTKEFLETHFGEAHREETKKEIEKGGYPDAGNGRYAQKLSYGEWYDFNNAQRSHQNFLEMAPTTFVLLLVAGIYFPIVAAVLGLGVFIFRIIYTIGYCSSGPGGRLVGALANDVLLLALLVISIISCVYFIQGKSAN